MAFDPSKFENDTAFDPSEFIVPANDTKGHSVPIHFRAASSVDRAIKQVVASRRFPYITPSDLMRHAIVRHLEWLTEVADLPQCRSMISMMKLEHDHIRREMEEATCTEHFTLVQQSVRELLSKPGGKREAQRMVARALSVVRQMPEGFYRDQHLVRLEDEFGHLLDEEDTPPRTRANGHDQEGDDPPARRRQ